MLKVFIITQDEPFYIPKAITHLLNSQSSDFRVVGQTVLKPHRKNKRMRDWILERTKIYTIWEMCVVGILYAFCKFCNVLFKESSYYSVKSIFNRHNVPSIESKDINCSEYLAKIRELDLDVIISLSCPQLFKEVLLSLPKKYCINAHGTLLPRHRGVFGSWWTLFSGDEYAGSTIHTMELKLDAGKILWQEKLPVAKYDTQYSIAYQTKQQTAKGLVETLQQINHGLEKALEPNAETSYHRTPTRHEGREFHQLGYSIINLTNSKLVLAPFFNLK